ncbi:MAG: hypothetical protein IH798_02385 [Gemmatimonadetes bacterium]|nr:hypothetical protein [Gemmatimonadota bacterium]
MSSTRFFRILLVIAWGAASGPAALRAQEVATAPREAADQAPAPPLFATHDVLFLTIVADFRQIQRDRGEDPVEHPAWVFVTGPDGSSDSLAVQLRTRGNFRLQRSNCGFPPLRVNVRTSDAAGTLFEGQDKLKLVVHCQDRRDRYEQYVLQEYLAYRVYNLLTPASFKVRLAQITYVDTGRDSSRLTKWAFFIEDEDRLLARIGAFVFDEGEMHQDLLDYDQATMFATFQYLIGNVDWSVSARHNVLTVAYPGSQPIAIPHDFDWSGVVNASYASPPPNTPIRFVTDRLFVSPCRSQYDFQAVFSLLREKRQAIDDLYTGRSELEEGQRRRVRRYYDRFYETIDDAKRVDREFVRGCY